MKNQREDWVPKVYWTEVQIPKKEDELVQQILEDVT